MALATSVLAPAPAPAEEGRRGAAAPRVAPQAVLDVSPALGAYTDEVLFGDVWRREGLSPARPEPRHRLRAHRERPGGAAARACRPRARQRPAARRDRGGHRPPRLLRGLARRHLGLRGDEAVFDGRGVAAGEPARSGDPLPLDEASEARRRAAVRESAGAVAPPLADYTNEVLFGDLWRRPGLAPRDRSLVTVAALIANGQAEQMPFHVNRAMDAGLTEAQLSEAVTHLAFYAG